MRPQDTGNEADIGLASIAGFDKSAADGSMTAQKRYRMIKNLGKMLLEPGAICPADNSSILHPGTQQLLPDLTLGEDYALVLEAAWQKFTEWYGKPATTLPREVIAYSSLETRIEVYPPVFHISPLLVPDAMSPTPTSRVDISSPAYPSVLAA
ncbi:hypothetical protein FRC08_009154 [Ceratobasidium sp. 394]|nr:hypothetical protein FRC08_009154 [Ceratobasidium sp. 394]